MTTVMMCLLITINQPEPAQTQHEAMLESMASVATERRYRALRDNRIIVRGE